jgi:hypothetical protein
MRRDGVEKEYAPALALAEELIRGKYERWTHLLACNVMMGQLYLTHAACAEGLGEGVVSEDTIRGAWPGRIDCALGLPWNCGMGLFGILAWPV